MSISGRGQVAAFSALVGVAAALWSVAGPAAASSESSWTNERVLDCGDGTVVTHLTPAGFGTPFHVDDSQDVIVPKHVEVIFPGETVPITTFDTPGFEMNQVDTVECSYTDPAGLFVTFIGVRT